MKTIYTLGYIGSTPDDIRLFVDTTGALLVDTRMNPFSRAPQWQGYAIERSVGEGNYLQCKALGNRNYRNDGPIVLAEPALAAQFLLGVMQTRNIILMCGCKDVRACHRKVAAETLQEVWARLIKNRLDAEIVHLPTRFADWKEAA